MNKNEQVLSRLRGDILLRGLLKNTLDSYTLNVRIFLTYCKIVYIIYIIGRYMNSLL
jgi:hypothetical protein